jgi:hypothetical protein
MKISNIIAGLTDAKAASKRPETIELSPGKPSQAQWPDGLNPAAAAELRKALAGFDVTAITPDEFSTLVQRLYKAGAISQEDYQQLAAIRADLHAEGIRPDERVNLVEFYGRKLRRLQSRIDSLDPAERQQLAAVTLRLDWVQKLAAMRQSPQGFGVTVVV